MGLDILTAASQTALIELAAVKQRLSIAPSDTSKDVLLQDLIIEASNAICEHLGRDLGRQDYHETIAGLDKAELLLARFPVDRDSVTAQVSTFDVTQWVRVHDTRIGKLFLLGGWSSIGGYTEGAGYNYSYPYGPDGNDHNVDVWYTAGYLLPAVVTTWQPSATYASGSWVRPASGGSPLRFLCTAPGVSATTEPAWPTPQVSGTSQLVTVTTSRFSVADGSVTWSSRDALELPLDLRKYAWIAVKHQYELLVREVGLVSQGGGTDRWAFDPSTVDTDLPNGVKRGLHLWDMGRVQ
jgi:hypothetical protein